MSTIKNKEYNARIVVDKNGNAEIVWALGLYRTKRKNVQQWKSVPDSIRQKIATAVAHSAL
jgi:hypothetical protein